jgi:predicted aspartyl protease
MIVDANINGHPYKCMFDSGAPGLLFGKNQLREMGIPLPQGPATTTVSGWAGVALPAWIMNLTVKVGNVERTLPATIQDDLNLRPLIGYAFIKGFQYEIDQKAKCMLLKKEQDDKQSINSLYDVPCRVINTKPLIPVEVNNSKVPFFIDTGAAITIMNPMTAAAAHIDIPENAPVHMAGGIGGMSPYRAVNMDIRLGPIIKKDFQVLVGGNAGNAIGQDFLSGWRFTVDEQKGYMRFFH